MKRSIITAITVLCFSSLFTACEKEAGKEKEPEVVVCYFEPYLPVRIINTKGDDLLNPLQLPGGTIDIKWEVPGSSMPVTKMNPAVHYKNGQAHQYYVGVPLTNSDKGLSIYFSVKTGDTDTLFIRTAASSSKPYGLAELHFNGTKIEPKMLFDSAAYGVEVVKGNTGY